MASKAKIKIWPRMSVDGTEQNFKEKFKRLELEVNRYIILVRKKYKD